MALSVLNNIASLAAQNQLTITNSNLQKALFQLSSGSRINTGADDAAAWLLPTVYTPTSPPSRSPPATPTMASANCRLLTALWQR